MAILIKVNGEVRSLEADPETPLLYVLRNDLGLKSAKYGCGNEQCGACKVLVDGQAVPSCKLPIKDVQGLSITTLEGLGTRDHLHPLQEAFIETQAIQCGYCAPGMIIGAHSLLNRVRYPADEEIKAGLDGHLCRCGVYERIRRAIRMRTGREMGEPAYQVIEDQLSPLSEQAAPDDLPSSLLENPALDNWIRINTDETVTLFTGKVEYGQGIKTALAQIGASALGVSIERVRMASTDSAYSPNEGLTVGSVSLESSGRALRLVARDTRRILLNIALEELEADPAHLIVADGVVTNTVTGKSTTYWKLFGGKTFDRNITPLADHHQVFYQEGGLGEAVKRLDLVDKVTGAPVFIQDLDFPGMVYARVVFPPHYHARLSEVDTSQVERMPGVLKVVVDGSFLGVIASREEQAVWAAEALRKAARWTGESGLPPEANFHAGLLKGRAASALIENGAPTETPIPPKVSPPGAACTIQATYTKPYTMHASLGPSAAVAHFEQGKLTLWVHSQGVYPIRGAVAQVIGLAEDSIHVIHVEGAGCYGHNGADDAALDAALLAKAFPGHPVKLQWQREDEHGWEPYGPAMVMKLESSLDVDGNLLDYHHETWSYSHLGRARGGGTTSGLQTAWRLGKPFPKPPERTSMAPHVGGHRNLDPYYTFPNKRMMIHFVPDSPLRVSALRGLGAYGNLFAIESFMDELAYAAGVDPVAFRFRYLTDPRAKAVLEAAAELAGWQPNQRPNCSGKGRGIAFARYTNRKAYAALVVDVSVEANVIHLEKAFIAADAGELVNPDGLSNQLEGGFIQAASWTLYEQVRWDESGITSRDWEAYPILRFPAAPQIQTILLNRPGQSFLGSGEAITGPTPAAIANAIFDATGLRVRDIPLSTLRTA